MPPPPFFWDRVCENGKIEVIDILRQLPPPPPRIRILKLGFFFFQKRCYYVPEKFGHLTRSVFVYSILCVIVCNNNSTKLLMVVHNPSNIYMYKYSVIQ